MIIYRCNACKKPDQDAARHCLTDLVVTLRAWPRIPNSESRTATATLHVCDTCLIKKYGISATELRTLGLSARDELVQRAALNILAETAETLRRNIEALLRKQLDHGDVPPA